MEQLSLLQRAVPLLLEWYRVCQTDASRGGARTTLIKMWVSEIMLQQTRVEAVKDYYVRFLQRFPDGGGARRGGRGGSAQGVGRASATIRAPAICIKRQSSSRKGASRPRFRGREARFPASATTRQGRFAPSLMSSPAPRWTAMSCASSPACSPTIPTSIARAQRKNLPRS